MPAIITEALTKHFPPNTRAVDGIDLAIEEGMLFGFLGANGSGKTTTIRMLTTLLRPTSGRAVVDGLEVTRHGESVRRRIGVALQEAGLDGLQTGREQLALQARLHGLSARQVKVRVAYLLRTVDMEAAADSRISTYSGGMKRRLDLACALVHRPKIVFLDEPTTGLDPVSRETIWQHVVELNRAEGTTFFLTTQNMEEADRLAIEVAIIEAGKIVAQGSPADLKAGIGTDVVTVNLDGGREQTTRAAELMRRFQGVEDVRALDDSIVIYVRDGRKSIANILRLLDQASLRVDEVTLARPTLDDVFLRKSGRHIESLRPSAGSEQGGSP
jgi:ABC-2 type transport system ATP-binding protein